MVFTLSALQTEPDICANSVDPDETTHFEPSHQDLHCLPFCIGFWLTSIFITKTRLFKYIENFTIKKGKFSDKNMVFFIFLLKT